MLKQNFSFRSPLLKYIFKNGSTLLKLKLFKTCKEIGTQIRQENFYKFDAIVILSEKSSPTELKLVDGKIVFLVNPNFIFQHFLTAKHLDIRSSINSPIISKINHSFITELRLSDLKKISYESLKKFLTPNLIRCELIRTVLVINDLKEEDKNAGMMIFNEAYNLKFLEIHVSNFPSLKDLSKIERNIKLKIVTVTHIKLELDIDSIILFIQNYLVPGGTLNLYFAFPKYTRNFGIELNNRNNLSKMFNYITGALGINFVKL